METTTLLLIIFSVVFVFGLFLYFLPKLKLKFKSKKTNDLKEKKIVVEKNENCNKEDNKPNSSQEQNSELVSLKDFLKIPPEKVMEQGEEIQPPQFKELFDPEAPVQDDPFEGDDEIFEREKYWDDDLSKRLYIDDRGPKKTSPFEIYERSREKTAKEEFKNLTPQMKKILLSDIIKKKQ